MSTTFYIAPFDPKSWEDSDALTPKPTSDLTIEPSGYRQKLVERWNEINFSESRIPCETVGLSPLSERSDVPNRDSLNFVSGSLIRWELPPESKEYAGLWGRLQENQQIVSFGTGPKKSFIDFILWHRSIIPEQYPLYLSNSSSWDSLLLTKDTTEQDIVDFTGIIS